MYNTHMIREDLVRILAKLRAGLEEILGERMEGVYLYGSQARGDALPDSDVDVLVVLRRDVNYEELFDETLDLVANLSLEYDIVISRAFVSQERFEQEMSPFLMNVRREAVPV